MKFEREYKIELRSIGIKDEATNIGILGILEELGSEHSDTVGYGVKDINDKQKVWILMDWQLKVITRPRYTQKLLAKTWARAKQNDRAKFYTYRDFEIFNENDEKIAVATSKWVLLDVRNERISKVEKDILNLYKPEEESVFDTWDIEKIPAIEDLKDFIEYKVRRFDIDVNKHMHNLNYLNLAYEALPEQVYNTKDFKNVRIMYKHQIKLGDTVKCYCNKIEDDYVITINSLDDKVMHAMVKLS